ncbi:DUF1048 domain-containing protein [Diaminobutyricibacter tongyongensis]|uniref:DUF1048 domain-containing protein n=1 Tax=Leifsonia tongyongensis TaxID=1268043 RepID=A0A6L9XWH4_9MICO|nr:DUF1048 domain-containing protein [Diaminobutyricibacter tongyongensis]NEN05636.1 DUF1048 domain-containing protein [Diaminobutyricibacter tongyongensis]
MIWIDKVVGDFSGKKRYLQYKERVKQLPEGYRQATEALQRYVMYLGPSDDSQSLMAMLDDLADLMERSAADSLPIREIVGEDPAEFAEAFMANYEGGSWIRKEQRRLASSIDDAVVKANT